MTGDKQHAIDAALALASMLRGRPMSLYDRQAVDRADVELRELLRPQRVAGASGLHVRSPRDA